MKSISSKLEIMNLPNHSFYFVDGVWILKNDLETMIHENDVLARLYTATVERPGFKKREYVRFDGNFGFINKGVTMTPWNEYRYIYVLKDRNLEHPLFPEFKKSSYMELGSTTINHGVYSFPKSMMDLLFSKDQLNESLGIELLRAKLILNGFFDE